MRVNIYILIFFAGYFYGSIPLAWLLIRTFARKKINGTKIENYTVWNVWQQTGDKITAILILLIELIKGGAAILLVSQLNMQDDMLLAVAIGSMVLGHTHSIWLKFKGGGGLALTAGALLIIEPVLIIIWIMVWGIYFMLIRRHLIAALVANAVVPLIVFFTKDSYFSDQTLLMILPVALLLFEKQLENVPDLISEKNRPKNMET